MALAPRLDILGASKMVMIAADLSFFIIVDGAINLR